MSREDAQMPMANRESPPNFRQVGHCPTCKHCQLVDAARGHGEGAKINWCVKYSSWPISGYVCDGFAYR